MAMAFYKAIFTEVYPILAIEILISKMNNFFIKFSKLDISSMCKDNGYRARSF